MADPWERGETGNLLCPLPYNPDKKLVHLPTHIVSGCLVIGILIGCGQPGAERPEDGDRDSEGTPDSTFAVTRAPLLDPDILPDARTVAKEINRTEAEYDETLVNSTESVDEYLAQEDKASLNLGVYLADAMYLNGYDKASEYMQYSLICQRMSNELGIGEHFGADLSRRLENNLGNQDSIFHILEEFRDVMQSEWNENDQQEIAALVTTGSLVESLYLMTSIYAGLPQTGGRQKETAQPLRQLILLQQEAVSKTTAFLKTNTSYPSLQALLTELEQLSVVMSHAQESNSSLQEVTLRIGKIRERLVR